VVRNASKNRDDVELIGILRLRRPIRSRESAYFAQDDNALLKADD
jgi:hypothetical protein